MNAHFPDDIYYFLTKQGVDFVTVICEDQNGDLNLHHYERVGINDGPPSNYVSELTRERVVFKPDIFDRKWKGAKNTITERKFVRVYRIPRKNDEKVVFSGSITPLAELPKSVRVYQIPRKKSEKVVISGSMTPSAELPNGLLNKLDNYIYKYASNQ